MRHEYDYDDVKFVNHELYTNDFILSQIGRREFKEAIIPLLKMPIVGDTLIFHSYPDMLKASVIDVKLVEFGDGGYKLCKVAWEVWLGNHSEDN